MERRLQLHDTHPGRDAVEPDWAEVKAAMEESLAARFESPR